MTADSNDAGTAGADAVLRELVRIAAARILEGALPSTHSGNVFAGTGQGKRCCLCELPVRAEDIEYEVVMTTPAVLDAYTFHRMCYDAWVAACRSRA